MNRSKTLVAVILMLLAVGIAAPASAIPITSFTATISSSDPTQVGRLFRTGVPSDWSAPKTYPGVTATGTTYNYQSYTIPGSAFDFGPGQYAGYVQVSVDDPFTLGFASAYRNSYNPSNFATNYMGDAGSSGNPFGNPGFFQIFLTPGDNLVLVFNSLGTLPVSLGILVEGFVDTEYTDPVPPVPEPASLLLLGTGVVAAGARLRRRRV